MKRAIALAVFLFCARAFCETCTLQTYASSWMVTGTPFTVKCVSGVYSGHLVSSPAKRFFRRGHLLLKFDQPVMVQSKNSADEGKITVGHGRQIANMLMDGGVGIGAKDLSDGLAGAVFKSWYMIPISCVTLSFFSNGGDVNLKPGYKVEVVPLRKLEGPAADAPALQSSAE